MLKTTYSTLKDKKKILFGHLVIWTMCEKRTMWHEIAHGKGSEKIVLSMLSVHFIV